MPSILLFILCFVAAQASYADANWKSITFDNDIFRGSDNGYTNGLYYSWGYIDPNADQVRLNEAFEFLLPSENIVIKANTYSLGQTMITPSDIAIKNPSEEEAPYSGLLVLSNASLFVYENYSDYIGASIGLVGPASLSADSQRFLHRVTGSTQPNGWNTQLKNEVVFAVSRKRSWQTWKSQSGNLGIVHAAGITAGTIESGLDAGFMLMYGNNLGNAYASSLLIGSRTSNPISMGGGWFIFHGMNAGYTFNRIALDGNTFQNSRSISYQHESITIMTGVAYSWSGWSLTLALVDGNILPNKQNVKDATQFGSFTIGWSP